jgi:hypothetical protein
MRKPPCDHEWIVDYDADAEAECYNDGLGYLPAEYICTKCRKRKKIKYENPPTWGDFLVIPSFLVFVLGLVFFPVIALVLGLYRELFPNKQG